MVLSEAEFKKIEFIRKFVSLDELFGLADFSPNENQLKAILHVDGPLFLVAGSGSGKTRVLLWRTVNLLAFHRVHPSEVFLSTFTQKASQQLKDGLLSLLGLVTNKTGVPFDLSQMYVGTVHSLCQRMLRDRSFSSGRSRQSAVRILDESLSKSVFADLSGLFNTVFVCRESALSDELKLGLRDVITVKPL